MSNSLDRNKLRYANSFEPSATEQRMASIKAADRLKGQKDSIWVEFVQLAAENKPLNLGQGFPDFAAPPEVQQALNEANNSSNTNMHQYTRSFGHPRLVTQLKKLYSKLINRDIDPMKEILVSVGAYESLFCSIMAFINPGDEVIIIEPFFDCYEPMCKIAGGKPVFIPLRPKLSSGGSLSSADYILDPVELASKFTEKTKMIIVNTPNNPLGKIFTRAELEMIGDLCKKHNVIAVMDEVYEWLVLEGHEHVRMAQLPGMWDRTITIGSAGKTFSVTGWKLGWAYGHENLIKPLQLFHQNCVYVCSTLLQEATAVGFEKEIPRMGKSDSYWLDLQTMLKEKRDKLAKTLEDCGLSPVIPDGGYFMVFDIREIADSVDLSGETGTKDYRFAKWLSKHKKLQGIPVSAFYGDEHKHLGENFLRFCFIKEDETLNKAQEILQELNSSIKK
ncbi:Kynurenine--oxoglutarate transaminase 3 [Nymphon striatum]|nr:Kynurenine--oxoglutarate transaminase 3 [Nymphon striatum]